MPFRQRVHERVHERVQRRHAGDPGSAFGTASRLPLRLPSADAPDIFEAAMPSPQIPTRSC
jgi:hypothetical protein